MGFGQEGCAGVRVRGIRKKENARWEEKRGWKREEGKRKMRNAEAQRTQRRGEDGHVHVWID
jgi:hypothetical protein